MQRSPEQHRAAYAEWQENAPENDSAIFHELDKSKSPRHGTMADRLAPLLEWMRRPEGTLLGEELPKGNEISTNWSIVPDNNNKKPADFSTEVAREITPSIEQIERSLRGVTFRYRKEPQVLKGGTYAKKVGKRAIHGIAVDGDIERNDQGQIIRLGSLRFSSGSAVEKVSMRADKIIDGERRMPTGAILGAKEKVATQIGEGDDPEEIAASNRYFADMLGTEPFRHKSGKRKKRKACDYPNPPLPPTSMSLNEARAFAGLSPVEKDTRPALPCGGINAADNFIGMQKTTCSGNGSQAWQDVSTALVDRERWAQIIAELPKEHIDTLNAAMKAENFAEIGRLAGQSDEYARRQGGKRELLAANDNFAELLKKSA